MVTFSWKRSERGLPLIPNRRNSLVHSQKIMVLHKEWATIFSREVESDHKRTPTSMGEN
jgi:hypothetical protein